MYHIKPICFITMPLMHHTQDIPLHFTLKVPFSLLTFLVYGMQNNLATSGGVVLTANGISAGPGEFNYRAKTVGSVFNLFVFYYIVTSQYFKAIYSVSVTHC